MCVDELEKQIGGYMRIWMDMAIILKHTPTKNSAAILMEGGICSSGHGETWESMPECVGFHEG